MALHVTANSTTTKEIL